MRHMIQTVVHQKLFGTVTASVFVIEFQGRGLPHVHCIFFLEKASKDKLLYSRHLDSLINSEIPSEDDDPGLRELVIKHMIHGPCGDVNPGAQCMSGDMYTKHFPKYFRNEASSDDRDFYEKYKRRGPVPGSTQPIKKIRTYKDGRAVERFVPVDNF